MSIDPGQRGLALALNMAEIMSGVPYDVRLTAISVLLGQVIQDWTTDEREMFFLTLRDTAENFAVIFAKDSCEGNA